LAHGVFGHCIHEYKWNHHWVVESKAVGPRLAVSFENWPSLPLAEFAQVRIESSNRDMALENL
jgi:hypothetical protein